MSGLTSVRVDLGPRSYDVWIGEGAVEAALRDVSDRLTPGRVALLVDANLRRPGEAVVRATLDAISLSDPRCDVLELPSGESAKTLAVAERICRELVSGGWERGDLVVGLGGGAATDVAGFVASILLRGVPWVSLPTSLLGMVDAAVGGKTAVNLPEGKNLVGAFWHPLAVGCDPSFLSTLPARELRAGMAEVVKTGWIGDPDLLEMMEADPPTSAEHRSIGEIVRRCVAVKARVVSEDERESGVRASLNFGHTLGHAIETDSRGRWLHGEAVALGMVAALHLSVSSGRCDEATLHRLVELLERLGLPVRDGSLEIESVLELTGRDKKRSGGEHRYQLTTGVGSVSVARDLDPDAPRAALEFLRR